jgi:hypothetical protein
MNLRLYLRVIGRFWAVVALGVALAAALAFISFFRFDYRRSPHVTYRQSQTWKGNEVLMLTQRGFPWGRSVYPYVIDKKTGQLVPTPRFADPSRFAALAVFYAELANSDAVRKLVTGGRALNGSYSAKPVVNRAGGDVGSSPITQIVPLIEVDGFASTPEGALSLSRRVSESLRTYLRTSQADAAIPPKQRIVVQVLSTAKKATLARDRRLTIPIVAFLGVLIATLGLVFVFENLWPRPHPARETETEGSGQADRTAAPTAVEDAADVAPVFAGPDETDEGAPDDADGQRFLPVPAAANGGRRTVPRTLGRRLRSERIGRELDLQFVQAHTAVPTRDLRALESDRLDLLPSAAEGRRALTRYVDLLELDPEPLLEEFDSQLAAGIGAAQAREAVPATPWKRAKALSLPISLIVVTIGVGLLLMFWRGWLFTQGSAGNVFRPAAPAAPVQAATPKVLSHAQPVATTRAASPAVGRPVGVPASGTRPERVVLVVSAPRGSSWLVVRNRWNHGKVLYAGVLPQGHTVRFRRLQLWVRFGAASNLDVTVNDSHPDAGLYGTLDAVVSHSGFRKVPLTP